jgi:hypothetical protein
MGLVNFIYAVGGHWVASMTGIVSILVGLCQFVRRKPLAPSAWIAVGLCVLFFASYQAWDDEHEARVRAEAALSTRAPHLTRSLAYDGLAPVIAPTPDQIWLRGVFGTISNVGQDTLKVKLDSINVYLGGAVAIHRSNQEYWFIPPLHGEDITVKPSSDISIRTDLSEIIVEITAQYDTVPPTGIRISYRKAGYHINRTEGGGASLSPPTIIEQREE